MSSSSSQNDLINFLTNNSSGGKNNKKKNKNYSPSKNSATITTNKNKNKYLPAVTPTINTGSSTPTKEEFTESEDQINHKDGENFTITTNMISSSSPTNMDNTYNSNYVEANKNHHQQQSMQKLQTKKLQDILYEWIELSEEQIYPMLQSLHNLRLRLHLLHLYNHNHCNHNNNNNNKNETDDSWKGYGYRQKNQLSLLLNDEDVLLSVHYAIQKHEVILMELRRHYIPSLSTTLDTYSRRFEDLYSVISSSSSSSSYIHDFIPSKHDYNDMLFFSLDDYQMMYISLSKELYRKQKLLQLIIDTSSYVIPSNVDRTVIRSDGTVDDNNDETKDENDPIKVIQYCIKVWSYRSRFSELYPYSHQIQAMIKNRQKTNSNSNSKY